MDNTPNHSAVSGELADLPWEAYFDAILPRDGSPETIPVSFPSSVPVNFNSDTISDISNADTYDTIDSSTAFDLLTSSNESMSISFPIPSVDSHSISSTFLDTSSNYDTNMTASTSVRQSIAMSMSPKKARKPRPENEYMPSSFRPSVPADRRILMWTTPHSEIAQAELDADLPIAQQKLLLSKLLNAVTDETRTQYGAGLLRFTQYCDRHAIPEGRRMPASYVLLAGFIADASCSASGKAIRNWMNGLRLWHIFNNAEWNGKHSWISSIIRNADKEGIVFKRPLRNPITLDHLRALRQQLDLKNPLHAAIWAIAVISFWACRRLGELLPKYTNSFDTTFHVSRATRITFYTVNSRRVVSFHLPWTKTTGPKGFDCILTATGDEFCPVDTFSNHLSLNKLGTFNEASSTPLFAYQNEGIFKTMDKKFFLSFTKSIFKSAGLELTHGHSYRIGGTLKLLLDGVPPETIMKIGSWSSLCFLIYWQRLEQIIPLAVTQSWDANISKFAKAHELNEDVEDMVFAD